MRIARVAVGLLLTLVGLSVTVVGAVAAFWLVGPDNTLTTSEKRLTSEGLSVMTAPDLLDRHGATLHVTALAHKPVFIGIGQDIDVANYLRASEHTRVVRYTPPSDLDTQEMQGRATALKPPTRLSWWVAKASGPDEQSIAWPIADGQHDLVVMNSDGSPAVDAKVTFGVEIDGAFAVCLLVFGAGTVLLILGLLLVARRKLGTTAPPSR
ncbi:hypothetical protein GCM10009789_65780 [Kribbella sancticallisti]|uniref:Uncharacterized protein n=1 Tax=Kribbella sancticallisti TaxID=460087 RepID=A0ABN2EEH8_9ACTN